MFSNLSSKISPKPAFSAGFKDRQGQRLHNALRHRVLRLLLLQRGQRGPQTGTCTPPRHAHHETKRVCTIVWITFVWKGGVSFLLDPFYRRGRVYKRGNSACLSVITFSFIEYSIIWWSSPCKPYIFWKLIMLATNTALFWPSTTE